jgi:hypothetical protein
MQPTPTYQDIQNDPQVLYYHREESSYTTGGKITLAIAIIIAIGALIANGCLYSQLGNYSFAIGGGGLGLSLLLFILSTCCRTAVYQNSPPPNHQKLETTDPQKEMEAKAKQEQEAADQAKQEREKAEKILQEAEAEAARKIAEIKARANAELEAEATGPFNPDKFRTDYFYRQQRLSNNNWFSSDSAKNKELFGQIDNDQLPLVGYDQLPDTVKMAPFPAIQWLSPALSLN